jgi:hypothetical protein
MDFQTMKGKLAASKYRNTQEFIKDIQLICENAKTYNGLDSLSTLVCDDIMGEVKRKYSEKSNSLHEEWQKDCMETILEREAHLWDAPPGLAHLAAFLEAPDVNPADLPLSQREQLQKTLGEEHLMDFRKSYLKLNASMRRKILSVLNSR